MLVTDKQTDRQSNADENIASLADVKSCKTDKSSTPSRHAINQL